MPRSALFALFLLFYVWPIDRTPGANVTAHVDAATAIVLFRSFSIDRLFNQHPTQTIDWSRGPSGHYYSNKAPGCALAAVPVVAALYYVETHLRLDPLSATSFPVNCALINWILNALASALAMVLLFRFCLRFGLSEKAALVGTLAVGLGTPFYPYATAYYAHNPTANLILVAAYLIFAPTVTTRRDAAAGFLAGCAVLFDYPSVIAVAVFGTTLLVCRPPALVAYVTGGLIPLAVYTWYHVAVFGSALATSYEYQNPRFVGETGTLITRFHPELIVSLTVLPFRGIFFYSPVLLIGLYGAAVMMRNPRGRAFASVALLLLGGWLLMNASHQIWWGGRTTGPRFIVPALILLGPLVAIGFDRMPRLTIVLLAISISNYVAITAVSRSVRAAVANPLVDVVYPMFARGEFERSNLGLIIGLPGLWSLAPLAIGAGFVGLVARRSRALFA